MGEDGRKLLYYTMEHLTEEKDAERVWRDVARAFEEIDRKDILENPRVLDLGGGASELSRYLNDQGVNCVSLDKKDWGTNAGSNQVRGDAYHMPFADASFDIIHGRGIFDDSIYKHNFEQLLPEMARVLKPGGILSVYDFSPPPTRNSGQVF